MYDTGKLHSNEFNISTFSSLHTEMLFTFRPSLTKQSYHACSVDVQLLASYQESLALLGLWFGVFLGDIDSDNAVSCIILIVWMLY